MNRIEICVDRSTKEEQEFYTKAMVEQEYIWLGRKWKVEAIDKATLDDGNTYIVISGVPEEAVKKYPLSQSAKSALRDMETIKDGIESGAVSCFAVCAASRVGDSLWSVHGHTGSLVGALEKAKEFVLSEMSFPDVVTTIENVLERKVEATEKEEEDGTQYC